MKTADLDAIFASTTDPAAATLARALREAWVERDGEGARANRLAMAVTARDNVLDHAAERLGWPLALDSSPSVMRAALERAADDGV